MTIDPPAIAIGDALCTFNPIYAQGMSAAARQARLLGEVLREHLSQGRGPAIFSTLYMLFVVRTLGFVPGVLGMIFAVAIIEDLLRLRSCSRTC